MSVLPSSRDSETDYAWELATLFPPQGTWSENEYLNLTDGTNRRIEFVDGRLEFLPMPTELHQLLVAYLYDALRSFVAGEDLGIVLFAPVRVRVASRRFREPDVLFLHKKNFHLRGNRFWKGADLVMEVVSGDPKDRERDYRDKLFDYAAAKVAEYWIVAFEMQRVTVHRLEGESYAVHGEFGRSQHATSALLPGFRVDVAALLATGDTVAD